MMPTLKDISFNMSWFTELSSVGPDEFVLVMMLLGKSAAQQVLTYEMPRDGGVKLTPDQLRNLTGLSAERLRRAMWVIPHYFHNIDGVLVPIRPWFTIGTFGVARPPIPASTRSAVLRRDDFTCVYCGGKKGPFDLDHVVPVSRGGDPLHIENLVTACAPCNRSKGAKSISEWIKGA